MPSTADRAPDPEPDEPSAPFASAFRAASAPEVEGYRILRVLGAGGHSTVYLAEDAEGRHVALKSWRGVGLSDEVRGRLAREVAALRDLAHPNLARLIALAADREGHPCVVMEPVHGPNLAEVVRDEGPLDPERVRALALRLVPALQVLAERHMVHRDIKPANVVLRGEEGDPVLVDFSVVKREDAEDDAAITRTGAAVGTSAYMAPEQCAGDLGPVDARTDAYGLGALLFQLVTGLPPWTHESGWERRQRNPWRAPYPTQPEERARVEAARARTPAGLAYVIETCLQGDPRDRFQAPRDVASALLAGAPPRRSRRRAAPALSLFAALVAASLIVFWRSRDHGGPLDPIQRQTPVAGATDARTLEDRDPMMTSTESLSARMADPDFLPFLKPRDWRGFDSSLTLKLLGSDDPRVPLIAFGWDELDRVTYLSRQDAKQGGVSDWRTIQKAAVRNLRRFHKEAGLKWSFESFPFGETEVQVAMLEGEHVAAGILIPALLEIAHKRLGEEHLVVGIPDARALWACSAGLAPFMESLARSQFEEAAREGADPITPAMILVTNGEVTGIAVPQGEPPEPADREVTWDRASYQTQADGSLTVPIRARDLAEVQSAIAYEMDAITSNLDSIKDEFPAFSGRLRFLVAKGSVLPTDETREALAFFEKKINEVTKANEIPIEVRIQLAGDD